MVLQCFSEVCILKREDKEEEKEEMRDWHKRDFLCKLPPLVFVLFFTVMTKWTVWTIARQAPLSMDFSRQEYQSG